MSYVAPDVMPKFETLSDNLRDAIMQRDVEIFTIYDLINVLEEIVKEDERNSKQKQKQN